jgi:hypothetical protein
MHQGTTGKKIPLEERCSSAFAQTAAAILPAAKIKPVQRLKIRWWAKIPENPRTP